MRQKSNLEGVLKKVGIGVAAACGASFLVCCLLGMLVLQELLPVSMAPAAAVCLTGICIFAACYMTAHAVPQSRLPVSLGMALIYSMLCLAVKAAGFPAWTLHITWSAAVPFAAAAAAGVLASRKKKRRR